MPKVYNKRHKDVPADAIYVGRPSPWGNPFKVGKDGTREEVIKAFEAYAWEMLRRNPDWLKPLFGKDLVCWCAPKACHADVLLELVNINSGRPFVVRSNRLNRSGFRVVLCKGNLLDDGTVYLTWTGNKVVDTSERVQLEQSYASMDTLLAVLAGADVRCILWSDTGAYQFINKA